MGRYGPEDPAGDDRPAGMHDPLEDEDRLVEEVRDRPATPFMTGWTGNTGVNANIGQGVESAVVLVGLAIRGVFMLVTWPVRWALRLRRRGPNTLP